MTIIPYCALVVSFLALAAVVVRVSRFYVPLVGAHERGRFEVLDGLRGIAAVSVFTHHAAVTYFYYRTGNWTAPPSTFYTRLGSVSVIFFFAITGFLFWTKAISRRGVIAPAALYRNRLCRLAPLYVVQLAIVVIVIGFESNFQLRTSSHELLIGMVRLCSFGFLRAGTLNGFRAEIDAGVTWTLAYEWVFYLLLPWLAVFATPRRFAALAAMLLGLHLLFPVSFAWQQRKLVTELPMHVTTYLHFLVGMAAAHLVARFDLRRVAGHRLFTVVPLACLVVLLFVPRCEPGSLAAIALVAVAFFSFVCGNDLFGILTHPAARFLGTVSYSIYLLHGVVLFLVMKGLDRYWIVGSLSVESYWLVIAACGAGLLLLSSVTYRVIEHPFMAHLREPLVADSTRVVAAPAAAVG